MEFKIIRAGAFYTVVLLVSPPSTKKFRAGGRYFLFGEHVNEGIKEISESQAEGYFSHHADGLGFEDIPDQIFKSKEDFLKWRREKVEKLLASNNISDLEPEERLTTLYKSDPKLFYDFTVEKINLLREQISSMSPDVMAEKIEFVDILSQVAKKVEDAELLKFVSEFRAELK